MELYIKTIGDPNFDPTKVHSTSEIAQLITQIETILFTNKREVLGNHTFGCNLEDLVYSLNYNNLQIKQVIDQQIDIHCPLAKKYKVSAEINFVKGTVRDIAYIDITIDSKYLLQVYIN
jgi:phage baseplate assembly protein W